MLEGTSADPFFRRHGWHAHNVYLHVLAETGILGLLAWCYLLVRDRCPPAASLEARRPARSAGRRRRALGSSCFLVLSTTRGPHRRPGAFQSPHEPDDRLRCRAGVTSARTGADSAIEARRLSTAICTRICFSVSGSAGVCALPALGDRLRVVILSGRIHAEVARLSLHSCSVVRGDWPRSARPWCRTRRGHHRHQDRSQATASRSPAGGLASTMSRSRRPD